MRAHIAVTVLTFSLSGIALAGPVLQQEKQLAAPAGVSAAPLLVAAYAAAWASRDPDRIASLHTRDTVFELRVDGETRAIGRQAVRDRFADILRDNPTYASRARNLSFGKDFVVVEYDVAMHPPAPFRLGLFRYTPSGDPYVVPAIDVIRFRDGLVSEKVTFLDTDTIRTRSSAVAQAVRRPGANR